MTKWQIKVSDTDGRALYAAEKIHQGEEILKLPGIGMTSPDIFSIQIYPGLHIDCSMSPAGALNHSCEANALVKDFRVVAWRCIEPGEMITIDYRRTEDKITSPFNCLCGAKSCIGRIE